MGRATVAGVALVGVVTGVAGAVGGCSGSGHASPDASPAASCAFVVEYDGRRYLGNSEVALTPAPAGTPDSDVALGRRLGPARLLGCDDGGGRVDDIPGTAYAVTGVDERWVIGYAGPTGSGRIALCTVRGADLPTDVAARLRAAHLNP